MTAEQGPSRIPVKRILSPAHLAAYKRSETHSELVTFVETLNGRIQGVTLSQAGEPSAVRVDCSEL
jgi:serine/threonine-protein phosphatase 2A activator